MILISIALPLKGEEPTFMRIPDVVYVGTGSDGIRSNVITGRGMYKSNDAGKTWTFIGLREVGQIGAVIIHPNDPDQPGRRYIDHVQTPDRFGCGQCYLL